MSAATEPDESDRAAMKRWLENWKAVSVVLDREREERLATNSGEGARSASLALMELWQPGWRNDNGEELLLHQRVFALARERR